MDAKSLPVGTAFAVFTGIGAIGITIDRGLALSGECLARTALDHCADLNRYCRSQIAESLTFRIRKEHFHGTTALC
jgi:hypothetical protein